MNVSIPLSAHINTKDEYIISDLETQDKDVLNKKNTLEFQSTLSPMYVKDGNAVYTTAGHIITKDGNIFTDEYGRKYEVDNSLTIKKSIDLTNLWNGELTSAVYVDDFVFSTWQTDYSFYIIKTDLDNNIINNIEISIKDGETNIVNAAIKIIDENKSAIIRVYTNDTSKISIVDNNGNVLAEEEVNYLLGNKLSVNTLGYIGLDDTDVRKRATFKYENNEISLFTLGWGCIGLNGLITGEPIPVKNNAAETILDVESNTISKITSWTGYTFLENGIGVLENANNHDISDNAALKNNSAYSTNDNNIMTWNNVDHSKQAVVYVTGWDIISNKPLIVTDTLESSYMFEPVEDYKQFCKISEAKFDNAGSHSFYQVDFSDSFGNLEWNNGTSATIENGCNPFPYAYSIFNRAESKNIYWSYGPGWAKSYVRRVEFRNYDSKKAMTQLFPTAIISFGLKGDYDYDCNFVRIEYLSPISFDITHTSYTIVPDDSHPQAFSRQFSNFGSQRAYARVHLFNPDIFEKGMIWVDMLGADNLPNHSILSKIPFTVRLNKDFYEQYYQLNYLSTSTAKTLITSASANNKEGSYIYNNAIFSNGLLVILEENGDVKLEKIADYIYRTNTLNGNNLFIDSKIKFDAQRGFIPYNGEETINLSSLSSFSAPTDNENTDGNSTYYSGSGYNIDMNDLDKRATSYILPEITMPLCIRSEEVEDFSFQLLDNKKEITKPFIYLTFDYKDDPVDHYYTHSLKSTRVEYQTGKKLPSSYNNNEEKLFGKKTFDSDKEGTVWWTTSSIFIFPLGLASKITGINYLSSTVNFTDDYTVRLYRRFNATFPVYNPNTEVYKGSTIFTIYGYNYSFDGQAIYFLGQSDDTSQNSFACYALGMQFLANSGTEAYFYSPFEKKIYLFTGSITLQMADSLAREGKIIDSLYSSCEQTLYLLTDEGNVIAKTQKDMALIQKVDPNKYHFEGTDTGMVLSGNWLFKKYRLYKTDETEWLPFEYETEFIGKNNSLIRVSNVDITFFRGNSSPISGNVYFECLSDRMPKKEKQGFTINKLDWNNSALFKVRFVPKDSVCKAFRFGIDSKDENIHIANVCINVEELSQNTNSPASNGHR
jgi:hypothetical protein